MILIKTSKGDIQLALDETGKKVVSEVINDLIANGFKEICRKNVEELNKENLLKEKSKKKVSMDKK